MQQPSRFDPTLSATLTAAFDRAWVMLSESDLGDRTREALTTSILEMAGEGITDIDALSVRALADLRETCFAAPIAAG